MKNQKSMDKEETIDGERSTDLDEFWLETGRTTIKESLVSKRRRQNNSLVLSAYCRAYILQPSSLAVSEIPF